MKKFALLLFMIALGAACHGIHHGVWGSGKLLTEKRNVGSVHYISNEGEFA